MQMVNEGNNNDPELKHKKLKMWFLITGSSAALLALMFLTLKPYLKILFKVPTNKLEVVGFLVPYVLVPLAIVLPYIFLMAFMVLMIMILVQYRRWK